MNTTASDTPMGGTMTMADLTRAWRLIENSKPILIGREESIEALLSAYENDPRHTINNIRNCFRYNYWPDAPAEKVFVLSGLFPDTKISVIDMTGWKQ